MYQHVKLDHVLPPFLRLAGLTAELKPGTCSEQKASWLTQRTGGCPPLCRSDSSMRTTFVNQGQLIL